MNHSFTWRLVSAVVVAILSMARWSDIGHAQTPAIDPEAEKLVRRMSDYLAKRQQFTVTTENSLEVVLSSGQKIEFDNPAMTTVVRPNRMRAERKGDITSQEFYYDGKNLTLYNPKENLYATVAAPANLNEMLDFAREKLDITAPGADLLYENVAEKILKVTSSGFVVGPSVVAGVKCTHLAFRGEDIDWQIWIQDGNMPLPRKFIITSTKIDGAPQFSVWMRNWDLTPKLAKGAFVFVPPKGSKKIEFLRLSAGEARAK